eukprot:jgi/Mesvir1/24827/Mv22067-RA.1
MDATVSVHGGALLPRVYECKAPAMPGCVRFTTRPCYPLSLGAPPPITRVSPWPRHAQHLKFPCTFSTAKGRCTLPISARLRDRSGKDKPKPVSSRPQTPRPAVRTVNAPTLKGLEPEEIFRWLADVRSRNDAVRTVDLLAALNELRSTGLARDPRFSQLLEQVWARWEDDPGSFTNRDLDTLARNLPKLGGDASKGLDRMEGEAMKRLSSMDARGAGREASGLLGAVQDEALGRGLDGFNPQNVSNLAHAFATAGKGTPALYSAVEAWVEVRVLRGSALACASAVEQGKGRFELVYEAAEAGMAEWVAEGFVEQDAANTLWALAVAGRPDSDAARALMVAWTKLTQPTDKDFWLQLKQVCQYILACVDASDHARDRFCSALLERWQGTAVQSKQQPGPSSSDLHLEVSRVLQGMGIAHKNEVPFFHGLSYVDILVDGKVAVEVDGPSHFYQDSGAITAVTLFKRQLLEKGGFRAVAVSYFEWISLKGRLEQENYLGRKLQGIAQ